MINTPYVYRSGETGATRQTELPAKICGVEQVIWMTARRGVLSSGATASQEPCLSCLTTWGGQSRFGNQATLENSAEAVNNPEYWPDYWTGDTTSNLHPFISFDRKSFGNNTANFLNIPYDASYSKLTEFSFSTIFRSRQINPNSTTYPDNDQGANVVLFQNGNDTSGNRRDGWGIDFRTSSNSLRIWYYDNLATGPNCDPGLGSGNSLSLAVSDWTKWLRLTVRVSGNTIQANIYNENEFAGNSGFTFANGCNNGSGSGVKYGVNYPTNPNWFIAGQKGPSFPNIGNDTTILNGSWDIAEYILYDRYLSNSCIAKIWDYFDYRYTSAIATPLTDAWIVATGESDGTIIGALRTFEEGLIANSFVSRLPVIYPFVGGNSTKHALNFMNTATYPLTFTGGLTHSATGVLPNGTTGFANTGYKMSNFPDINKYSIGFYSRTNTNTGVDMGYYSAGGVVLDIEARYNGVFAGGDGGGGFLIVSNADGRGFYVNCRTTSSRVDLYKNGVSVANKIVAPINISINMYLFARNDSVGTSHFSAKECAFSFIGYDFTQAEMLTFYNLVQDLQTALSRQV